MSIWCVLQIVDRISRFAAEIPSMLSCRIRMAGPMSRKTWCARWWLRLVPGSVSEVHKFKMETSKMVISKMSFHFCIASKHHFVSVFSLDQSLHWKVSKIILDSPPRIHCRCGRRHPNVWEFATERLVHLWMAPN